MFRKFILSFLIALPILSTGQIIEGSIVFERKTNLKKVFGDDPRMANFLTEENKIRIEKFELHFSDSIAAFIPMPLEEEERGFMKYLTQKNSVYQHLDRDEKITVMDLFGSQTYLKGPMSDRKWKITDRKRKFDGYECRRAIWEMNDSTRIYAWFSTDLVPSAGPLGFSGLPGTILGLATEDGSIIVFAKEVKLGSPKPEVFLYDPGKNDIYTKEELKAILAEKMGKWMKPEDLDAMFAWL